jgi:hypothetical protein
VTPPLACAWEAVWVLLTVAGTVCGFGLFILTLELGRFPGFRARWHLVVRPYDRTVGVELRKRGSSVDVAKLDPKAPDFDQQLHDALAQGRERLIALKAAERARRRRLPR